MVIRHRLVLHSSLASTVVDNFSCSQVDSAWERGDVDRAQSMSNAAIGWNIAGIVSGALLSIATFFLLVPFVSIITESHSS